MKVYTISEEREVHMDDVVGNHISVVDQIKMKHNDTGTDECKTELKSNKDTVESIQCSGFVHRHKLAIVTARNFGFLILYLAYYSYAMYCNFGDEGSIRLTVFTGFGILFIGWKNLFLQEGIRKSWKSAIKSVYRTYKYGSRPKVIRWCLYIIWTTLMVYYLIANVALKDPRKLRSLGGYVAFILILVIISNNKRKINWHCVFWGSAMQCLLGYFVIKTSSGATVILWFSDRLGEFLSYSNTGAKFVFGNAYMDHPFAMQTMPTIILFFAAIQVLVYLGTIKFIVRTLGKLLAIILDVSAPEATNACANIFLGGIESAILVIEYIDSMPTSRLFTLITNWFASCGGSALIQFISFGVPAEYLLAASAMSAPAAIVCAKLTFPDVDLSDYKSNIEDIDLKVISNGSKTSEEQSDINKDTQSNVSTEEIKVTDNNNKDKFEDEIQNKRKHSPFEEPKSIGEALVVGTKQGTKLVANILGNMIVALSLIEFLDKTVEWLGERINIHITLKVILSYAFYPFVYIMGVDEEDCLRAGEMLGIRTVSVLGISYQQLGEIIENRKMLMDYMTTFNETITYDRGDDIYLPQWNQTLTGGVFSEHSELIVSYALCGFASVPMIGMTLGALTVIIPNRSQEVTKLAVRGLIAGTMASYLTACAAGLVS